SLKDVIDEKEKPFVVSKSKMTDLKIAQKTLSSFRKCNVINCLEYIELTDKTDCINDILKTLSEKRDELKGIVEFYDLVGRPRPEFDEDAVAKSSIVKS